MAIDFEIVCSECFRIVDADKNDVIRYKKVIYSNELVKYYDLSDGSEISPEPTPGVDEELRECAETINEYCVESQEWTYALDNTGTSFSEDNTIEITLSDGSSFTFEQPATTNWTPQMQIWGDEIQAVADAQGLAWFVETRFRNPSNPSDLSGGGGFSGPPSVAVSNNLTNMLWRYVNIQICPGQPVPVQAVIIDSSNPARIGYNLSTDGAVLGPIQKFWICKKCGEEPVWYLEDGKTLAEAGQIPNCYEPCGTLALTDNPPDRACEFFFDTACDNNNSTDPGDFTNLITRRVTYCSGEQVAVDYFTEDPSDPNALVDYTLVGQFVDCDTGDEIELPTPECEEFELTELFKIDLLGQEGLWRRRERLDTGSTRNDPVTLEGSQLILSEMGLENGIPIPNFTPDTDVVIATNANVDDTNNTANIPDYEVKETYVAVSRDFLFRFSGTPEGYQAVYIGECCGDPKKIYERSTNIGGPGQQGDDFGIMPKGIHSLHILNLDSNGTNSSATFEVSLDGGQSWVSQDSAPWLVSNAKPIEECIKVKVCEDTGAIFDVLSGDLLLPEELSHCSIECEGSDKICLTPTGEYKCFGVSTSGDAEYDIGTDNETDGTFSIGGTGNDTIKREVDSPASASDGLAEFTLAIQDCINEGGTANLTITDSSNNIFEFPATSVAGAGNADGSGSRAFQGPGAAASGSGKIRNAVLNCTSEEVSGKAYSFYDCENDSIIRKDENGVILTQDQIDSLVDCDRDCPISTFQSISCASEAITDSNAGAIAIGDEILTLGEKDCDGVIIGSKRYLLPSQVEVVDAVQTESCDPEPDIETIKTCVQDEEGRLRTQISIINPSDPSDVTVLYYDSSFNIGTPTGDPDNFTDCSDYVEFDNVKLCEIDAEFLLLIDSTGSFARYSFLTGTRQNVNTLSVNSAGGSADYDNFRLYNFVAPNILTTIDVNTDTQLPNILLTDGVINPNVATNPKTFSAASFRISDGFLYAQDTGGADAGLYRVNVTTGVVDFVTTITGVSGTGTSIAIDNTTDTLIVNGSNLSYQVDWNTGVATLRGNPPIQPNGSTFDANGNFYVTQGNDTYRLDAGLDPNDGSNYVQIIDDWTPGANSIAYYRTQAPQPSCFFRRFGILEDGTRELIGDFNVIDDSPRTIVGDVDCCENLGSSGGTGGNVVVTNDVMLDVPTTTVFDTDSYLQGGLQGHDSNYGIDIDAHPVAFPEGYVPPVYIQNKTLVNYNQGSGNTGQAEVGAKVWFPESAVLPVESVGGTDINIPTISVVDYDQNNDLNTDDDVQELVQAGYTKDIDALPIGVPAGNYLPVKHGSFTTNYNQGNGNTGQADVHMKVWFPESAVVRVEEINKSPSTISVVDYQGNNVDSTDDDTQTLFDNGYTQDVEAQSVATLPGVYLATAQKTHEQEYYVGNGNVNRTPVHMRVALPESAVLRTEEQEQRLEWLHIDTDVDGATGSIPADVQSWAIHIQDPNGPEPLIGMSNGTRSVPTSVGTIEGSTEADRSQLDHPITYNANGNRLYIVYSQLA